MGWSLATRDPSLVSLLLLFVEDKDGGDGGWTCRCWNLFDSKVYS